jgi:hypothetical protein
VRDWLAYMMDFSMRSGQAKDCGGKAVADPKDGFGASSRTLSTIAAGCSALSSWLSPNGSFPPTHSPTRPLWPTDGRSTRNSMTARAAPSSSTASVPPSRCQSDHWHGLPVPCPADERRVLRALSPSSAMFTAATWFHRFYMRYSMQDYHRQVRAHAQSLSPTTERMRRR